MAVLLEAVLDAQNETTPVVEYCGPKSANAFASPGGCNLQVWAERGGGSGTITVRAQENMPDLAGNNARDWENNGNNRTVPANNAVSFGIQRCVEGMRYRVQYTSATTVPVTVRLAADGALWRVVG